MLDVGWTRDSGTRDGSDGRNAQSNVELLQQLASIRSGISSNYEYCFTIIVGI